MTLLLFPALPGQGFATKRPIAVSLIAEHESGRTVRSALYGGVYEFEVGFDGLAADATTNPGLVAQSLQALLGLYLQCGGAFGTFLYTDPNDNMAIHQPIAVGDGATTAFRLVRSVGAATDVVSYATAISAVMLNGGAASNWSLVPPNILEFSMPPGAGVQIAASFSYAFQCRFLDDTLELENFMQNLWSSKSVKFRSLRP
ncbi:DUF2460 domain-containing protein [Methylocystis bryophila]|uniref:DUF2460 domain-containing protein n=1 Tax=Methylocystis bryophila TaxID=655015 RepID=A0A1W6MX90_9HYPH|nr:DUF2460 domain-containing protein [Methylocystis bryophila]ARN82166.1 hypothetical protein B1812_14945 [Methylocystis bryophila]BDV38298.1 hypothetical protein DSM21852_15510 [Methylocystis bryophila]